MARKSYFSVATFNVKNLASPGISVYGKIYTETEYRQKLGWLANQLLAMDADIVCLQEVFDEAALNDLNATYTALRDAQPGSARSARLDHYDNSAFFENTASVPPGPKPGLALLSRRTVRESFTVQDISNDPIEVSKDAGLEYRLTELSRPLMVARVDLGKGIDGWIFNSHLKSKRPKFPAGSQAREEENALFYERAEGSFRSLALRSGEALALRREILKKSQNSETPVIVVGDLNDEIGAVTTEIVAGEQPWRRLKPDVKRLFWDVELYSAVRTHQRRTEHSSMYTHIYNGHYGTIDHILISQEFYYRNRDRIGDIEFVRAFNDHLTDDSLDGAPSIGSATDHGQLVVRLSIDPEKLDALENRRAVV